MSGPTLPDRVIAIDLIGVLMVCLLVVTAAATGQQAFLDVAMVVALISFVGTVAYATLHRAEPTMTDWLSSGLFIAGATLALLASVGVLRMPDVFTRMQASTKASTLGLGCLLLGLAIRNPELSVVITRRKHRGLHDADDGRRRARHRASGSTGRRTAVGRHARR